MSTAVSGAGGDPPPPPPPPGGGGDRRRPASGTRGRGSKVKKRRTAKRRGRPLQAMERMQIMATWSQLSIPARRSLWESLGEMLGETPAVGSNEPSAPDTGDDTRNQPVRTRVWERRVLRDVPLFREFGQLTARERREDTRGIPQLLSIAQGVVRRGSDLQFSDSDIRDAIVAHLGNVEALRALFGGPPNPSESETSEEDERVPMNDA